jgi:N6-L-threonylcarbamoyladenine synthase
VAANERLRAEIQHLSPVPVSVPPLAYCTDNAAMVGSAAFHRLLADGPSGWDLDVVPSLRLGTS